MSPGFLNTGSNGSITERTCRDYVIPNMLPFRNNRGHINKITAVYIPQIFYDLAKYHGIIRLYTVTE